MQDPNHNFSAESFMPQLSLPRRGSITRGRSLRWWSAPSTGVLRLYVRPIFDVLHEAADGACEFLILVCREWEDGNETEGEPGPSCLAMRRPIPTIVALRGYLLITFEFASEFFRAESDTECHDDMIVGW